MISDAERRAVAENLRCLADYPGMMIRYAEQFRDELSVVVMPDGDAHDHPGLFRRIADLIDPTCEARRDTVLKPAVLYPDTESDDAGREETVYRCSGCGEIVSYDEGYDPETDIPAYCERCGSRITGIGEPWDE